MPRRTMRGYVISDKMQKTVMVEIMRTKRHPLYKKVLRTTKKFMAHDEEEECREGDFVEIEECRPLSRRKHWRVTQILRHAGT
ncbi:MAG: 30S ribosomal protein S17 [Chloroflexota bacterium]|nr:30S ribosomal protein S17 [Chloroflexota bacterium]